MARLVKKTNNNYTNISNVLARDKRLSWKARGIFLYMWSQADNWQFYVKELVSHATDGEGSLTSGLKELEKYGYLKRAHRQTKNGVFDGMDWVLSDQPSLQQGKKATDGKTKEKALKNPKNPSDGKTAGWENHRMDNGSLRNNNSKNYQNKELSNTSKNKNIGQARPDDTAPTRKKIIAYLNSKLGTCYKHNASKNKQVINARLNEGYAFDDFKKVIDNKAADWAHDAKMAKYLRPETLFGTKMEGYVNEKPSISTDTGYHGFADDSYYTDHTKVLDDVSTDDLPF
ncbi:conserved phage C-terminal domain-containing protein [Limosilactobacillus pontis]|uniref:conserved phage C-terminal domain-containing protein n=1 Tax=Limosilactobacillus pontis TaxID=35787 RepID=UPI002F26D8FA